MMYLFYLLVDFFSGLFIVLPRRGSIDLSTGIIFFSKIQEPGASLNQRRDVIQSACGVLCLQMVASFYRRTVPSLEDLLLKLTQARAFDVEHGLVLARTNKVLYEYGFLSKTYRYISHKRLFCCLLSGTPVITSLRGSQGGHLVVLVGVSIEDGRVKKVLYLDPNYLAASALRTVTFDEWQASFNKRALIVSPS